MKGNHLDLSSDVPGDEPSRGPESAEGRPFLGVHFACCDLYVRVYLNAEGTGYQGRCPRCGKQVRFRVGPGGENARFWRAT